MFYKAMILSLGNEYEASGKLSFSEDKKSAFINIDPDENIDNIELKIKIAVDGSYYEVYFGDVEKIDKVERRVYISNLVNSEKNRNEDIKVDTNYDFNIMYTDADDDIISREVKMVDLSAGGFCFSDKTSLDTGGEYEAVFSFLNEPIVVSFGIIRRIYLEEDKKYVYGCRFLNLSMKEEEIIRKKVFQVLALKNKKDKR